MPRRKQYTADINVWHANGATAHVATVSDILSVRVKIPELEWLHNVRIDVDPKTKELTVQVEASTEDDAANAPRMTVRPDTSFTTNS